MKIVLYLVVMAGVTYLIRALPFCLFRNKVKSSFLQYFFAYIPYAVLAAMTLPYMLLSGKNPACAAVGFAAAVLLSACKRSLTTVALGACVASFAAGLFL